MSKFVPLPPSIDFTAFLNHLRKECMHETIYKDSEWREILVIRTLDAFVMANKWANRVLEEKKK